MKERSSLIGIRGFPCALPWIVMGAWSWHVLDICTTEEKANGRQGMYLDN